MTNDRYATNECYVTNASYTTNDWYFTNQSYSAVDRYSTNDCYVTNTAIAIDTVYSTNIMYSTNDVVGVTPEYTTNTAYTTNIAYTTSTSNDGVLSATWVEGIYRGSKNLWMYKDPVSYLPTSKTNSSVPVASGVTPLDPTLTIKNTGKYTNHYLIKLKNQHTTNAIYKIEFNTW